MSSRALALLMIWVLLTVIWLIGVALAVQDQGAMTWRAGLAAAVPFVIGLLGWWLTRVRAGWRLH